MSRVLLAIGFALPWPAAPAETDSRPQPLASALQVRSLSVEEADEGRPVTLEAVVGFLDAPTVFVQDATGGTFFRAAGDGPVDVLRVGDRVRVTGVSFPGLYLAGINEATFEVLGKGDSPVPVPVGAEDLAAGSHHYQRVSVEGVGRSVEVVEEGLSVLRLATRGRQVEIRLQGPLPEFAWIDARVRVTGLAAGAINDRRQLVQPYVRVAGREDLVVLQGAPAPEKIPAQSLAGLLRFLPGERAWDHRVRVKGLVLAAFSDGTLFLRTRLEEPGEGATSVAVALAAPAPIPVGRRVEVAGFPEMGRFSASLADAVVLESDGEIHATDAVPVTAREIFSGAHDADLVQVDATLSDLFRTGNGVELVLRTDAGTIRAELPFVPEPLPVPGSRLKLSGICRIEGSFGQGYRSVPDRIVLFPRTPVDLHVLETPNWWTAGRLAGLVAVLLGLVALAGSWIVLLRRQVARQSAALRKRIAREAVLEERERIAREFHDTLEQELAGLSLRLDAATACSLDERARPLVTTSRHLVSRIQSEARDIVSGLRSDRASSPDLAEALRDLVARCNVPGGPDVRLELDPTLPRLPGEVGHHLHMIAREAVGNALKHASSSRIHVTLHREGEALVLEVGDNGGGMNPPDPAGLRPGHFGCQGIRERAARLGARAEWKRASGGGTLFRIEYPLPR